LTPLFPPTYNAPVKPSPAAFLAPRSRRFLWRQPMRAVTISVGSGKGGTGKSVVITNLASILARRGLRVCLVDLDVGGADAHVLFGFFKPGAVM